MARIARLAALLLALVALAGPLAATATATVTGAAATPDSQQLSYSGLRTAIHARTIKRAELYPQQGLADLTMRDGKHTEAAYPAGDQTIAGQLADAGAQVTVDNSSNAGPMTIIPLILLVITMIATGVFMAVKGRGAGGMRAPGDGERRAELADSEVPEVTFADVAGVDEAVESLRDLLVFLTDPGRYERLGAKLPRGVVFHGPPGTGKTLLAKALAGEAGVPFYSVAGSEFVEMIVGRGAARVRKLFASAAQHEAAVIFFDEFDALGKKRSAGDISGGTDEREQTLNQLLVEMDGFKPNSRIICIAATNRVDTLDPAVLRPGRFGEQILVDLPSEQGRRHILAVHAAGKPLADDVDLDRLAHITYGSSGADLADMLNRAAIIAGKAEQDVITQADIEDGYLDAIAGPRKRNPVMREGERQVVAVHEAGHVLAAELCPSAEKAMRVSIQPRGRAGGMAVYGRTDRMLHDPQYLHEKLVGVLGGRAAEFATRGVVTSGAANDLQQANAMARQAVEELGFSGRAGQLIASQGGQSVRVSEQTVAVIDDEVRRLVEEAYQDAVRLLSEHRRELERLADALLAQEDLDRPEIVAVLAGVTDTPRATPRRAAGGPRVAPVAAPAIAHTSAARPRSRRVRARVAAFLLRERPADAAYARA